MEYRVLDITDLYHLKEKESVSRNGEFERIGNDAEDEGPFGELAFYLLTPQSKARAAWSAIKSLSHKNIFSKGRE